MDVYLVRTFNGLVPAGDDSYEQVQKMKIGQPYKAKITKPRNIDKHRRYFALIKLAWAYQNEKVVEHFKNSEDGFRKSVELAAGWYDTVYSIGKKEWTQVPKSIAFDNMDDLEFDELYKRVKDVLFMVFLKHITEEEFMNNLSNF